MIWRDGDSHAGADADLVPKNMMGFTDGTQELLGKRIRPAGVRRAAPYQGKFIRAQPRDDIGVAVGVAQPLGNALQKRVADRMAKPVVHGLRTGAFAEAMVVDQSQAVAIPKDIALDSASLIACGVLTGMGAVVNTAGVKAGSSVVVIGCGGVGLNAIQGARLAGASPIIAVDVEPAKLAAARDFGATETINAKNEDVRERAATLNGGRKADWVFVSVGVKGAAEQGVSLMKRNGATVLVGMPPSGVTATIDPGWLAADGQRILGSKMGSARPSIDVPMIVRLYREGRLKLDQLISGRYRLESINEALASSRSGAALRNVIVF